MKIAMLVVADIVVVILHEYLFRPVCHSN